ESKHEGGKWYTSFTFHVEKEYGEPVTTLSKENYNFKDPNTLAGWAISFFNPTVKRWQRINQVDNVAYSAGGNYNVIFKSPWSQNIEFYDNYLILWIRDERGILVEAYSYYLISYEIKEQAIPKPLSQSYQPPYPYQTYVFELKPDGKMLWFNSSLKASGNMPPIPPVFVKQLRVFTTINGAYTKPPIYSEAPYQVERWEAEASYPYPEFEAERERFGVHRSENGYTYENRLVFMVNYTMSSSIFIDDTVQRVNITWIDDCDTPPATYYISITPEDIIVDSKKIPSAVISTNIYKLQIVSQSGFSHYVDWSVSFKNNIYHVEYQFHGVGYVRYDDGWWEPHYLPSGDWTIVTGPVRAVCFRRNNTVENSPDEEIIEEGYFSNEMVILIPYNVKYWTLYANIVWRHPLTDRRYFNLFSMISGTKSDYDGQSPSPRITSWAYLKSNNMIESGNYGARGYTREFKDYSYWIAQYKSNFGSAIFLTDQTLKLIQELFRRPQSQYKDYISYSPQVTGSYSPDELLIFTSHDYDRRVSYVLPHCWWCLFSECGGRRRCSTDDTFSIMPDLSYSYKAAAWIYNGGFNEPNIYYRMFIDSDNTNPVIQRIYVPGF
ncbi:MAG: hypothetical protein QXR05_11880, partial [Candidatus Methanomethylicia archaeon]